MQRKIVAFFLLLILSSFSIAQEKTFIREYTHKVGDADSKITSRAIALNQVKKILLEEVGVYLESTFEIEKTETSEEYKELTNSQITSITAGITETKILGEKWNGIEYYIKAEIIIDVNDMLNKLNKIAKDRDKTKQLIEANAKAEQAYKALSKIEEKLKETISEKEKLKLQLEYSVNSNVLSASDWYQKGYNAEELREYDNAILYYQKSIDIESNYIVAYNNMGNVYSKKGNTDKAIKIYQKVIEIDPNNVSAYSNIGAVYAAKGNYDKAIDRYQKAILLDPNNDILYYFLGLSFYYRGDLDKAIVSYLKSIEINHDSPDSYNNIGVIYRDKDNYNEALKYYKKAIQSEPTYSQAYYNIGELLMSTENIDNIKKAAEYFKKAARLGHKDSQKLLEEFFGESW